MSLPNEPSTTENVDQTSRGIRTCTAVPSQDCCTYMAQVTLQYTLPDTNICLHLFFGLYLQGEGFLHRMNFHPLKWTYSVEVRHCASLSISRRTPHFPNLQAPATQLSCSTAESLFQTRRAARQVQDFEFCQTTYYIHILIYYMSFNPLQGLSHQKPAQSHTKLGMRSSR